ncbi:MAG TPA: hypothetical protein VNR38_05775 [Ureibacillus sp.]|nr:hypothetical protein [Ureibacillus sp.]
MKKIIGLFIVVFISIGLADLIEGIILTFFYQPNFYQTISLEMAKFVQYAITAVTVTIVLWSVYKVKDKMKGSKSSVDVA